MSDDGVDGYVFDLYGTLVDYSSLASRFNGVTDPQAFVGAWRGKQLAYAFAATLMDRYVDFDAITAAAYRYVAATHDAPRDEAAVAAAVGAWSSLPAYADAASTLRRVRERGLFTAVLSNGTPAAIAATVAACGFGDALDAVLSVDAVKRFKPHPDVYALAVSRFERPPERIGFVSSNGWDATGAATFGFRTIWCNRGGLPAETLGPQSLRTIATLDALFAR